MQFGVKPSTGGMLSEACRSDDPSTGQVSGAASKDWSWTNVLPMTRPSTSPRPSARPHQLIMLVRIEHVAWLAARAAVEGLNATNTSWPRGWARGPRRSVSHLGISGHDGLRDVPHPPEQ